VYLVAKRYTTVNPATELRALDKAIGIINEVNRLKRDKSVTKPQPEARAKLNTFSAFSHFDLLLESILSKAPWQSERH
jgi:hypothetical protein